MIGNPIIELSKRSGEGVNVNCCPPLNCTTTVIGGGIRNAVTLLAVAADGLLLSVGRACAGSIVIPLLLVVESTLEFVLLVAALSELQNACMARNATQDFPTCVETTECCEEKKHAGMRKYVILRIPVDAERTSAPSLIGRKRSSEETHWLTKGRTRDTIGSPMGVYF